MLPGQGNGVFRLHAIAFDREGRQTLLESRTITCTNATSTAPFGAIDTPTQGQTVSGSVNNFGWVLVPGTARADVPGGGTVRVVIDGAVVAVPGGWTSRPDISALFPTGYSSLASTLAVHTFDTTAAQQRRAHHRLGRDRDQRAGRRDREPLLHGLERRGVADSGDGRRPCVQCARVR